MSCLIPSPSLDEPIIYPMSKGKQKYFTIAEIVWKIVAPVAVALVKTLLENRLV